MTLNTAHFTLQNDIHVVTWFPLLVDKTLGSIVHQCTVLKYLLSLAGTQSKKVPQASTNVVEDPNVALATRLVEF